MHSKSTYSKNLSGKTISKDKNSLKMLLSPTNKPNEYENQQINQIEEWLKSASCEYENNQTINRRLEQSPIQTNLVRYAKNISQTNFIRPENLELTKKSITKHTLHSEINQKDQNNCFKIQEKSILTQIPTLEEIDEYINSLIPEPSTSERKLNTQQTSQSNFSNKTSYETSYKTLNGNKDISINMMPSKITNSFSDSIFFSESNSNSYLRAKEQSPSIYFNCKERSSTPKITSKKLKITESPHKSKSATSLNSYYTDSEISSNIYSQKNKLLKVSITPKNRPLSSKSSNLGPNLKSRSQKLRSKPNLLPVTEFISPMSVSMLNNLKSSRMHQTKNFSPYFFKFKCESSPVNEKIYNKYTNT